MSGNFFPLVEISDGQLQCSQKKVISGLNFVSKKFSRNFACQNNFRFFEKRQPLKRNRVERIQLNFFLSKKVNYRQETVSKKFNRNFACRNNSLEPSSYIKPHPGAYELSYQCVQLADSLLLECDNPWQWQVLTCSLST